jgi:hypothetical protein
VPTTAGRRVGIVVILVLLAGGAVLTVLPSGVGAVRVAGLSILWWYAVVVAPVVAVLVTVAVLLRRASPRDPVASVAPPA